MKEHKMSRRSFLKVSGCLMLGSAVSGLLCGAGDPADGGAAVPTVGGLRVNYVRAFAKDYGNNFREMEIHLEIENTNDFLVYFNQENFLVHLGDMTAADRPGSMAHRAALRPAAADLYGLSARRQVQF